MAFAENPAVALWGLQGRYNGLIMLLACTVLYFAVQLTGGGFRLHGSDGCWQEQDVLLRCCAG